MADTWIKPARLERYFNETKRLSYTKHKCHTSVNECAAQRRQAFMDRRKTKLVAQSLHVQNVLLRANSRQNLVEKLKSLRENLQQADSARRYLLMLTSTSCALRVAHSKAVARDIQSLRSANADVLRIQVEDRHRQAEERRQAFLRKRRQRVPYHSIGEKSGTLPNSRSSLRAAITIQRFWRTATLQRTFSGLWLQQLYNIGEVSFTTAADMLNTPSTIRAATKLLQILLIFDSPASTRISIRTSVRTFLAAFMIVYRSTEVLSSPHSSNLVNSSARLLKRITFVMSTVISDKPIPITNEWESYLQTFQIWKNHDRDELAYSIAQKYAELELLSETVVATEDELYAKPYQEGITSNQKLLMMELSRLVGGAAQPMLQEALSRLRSTKKLKAEEFILSREKDKSGLLATIPSNREIVHEILLDRAYRLQTPGEFASAQASGQIKRLIVDKLEGTPTFLCQNVPSLARHLKSKLMVLCANARSLTSKVEEAIDITIVEQQSRRGVSCYDDLMRFTISMMREMASPFRDPLLQALANEEPKKQLIGVLDALDSLSIDLINFHLTLASPMILENGVDYERNCFREYLERGSITLTLTKLWLEQYTNGYVDHVGGKFKAWTQAFIDLLLSDASLPETMEIERKHILAIRIDISMILRIATFMVMAKSKLAYLHISWTRMWKSLWDRRSSTSTSALFESFLSEVHLQGVHIDEASFTMLQSLVTKALEISDPTSQLLRKRAVSCLQRQLDGAGSAFCSIGLPESNYSFRQIVGRASRVAQVNREIYSPWYDLLMGH